MGPASQETKAYPLYMEQPNLEMDTLPAVCLVCLCAFPQAEFLSLVTLTTLLFNLSEHLFRLEGFLPSGIGYYIL